MALLDEIKAKCSAALLASRDTTAIAAAVNVGRVKANMLEIGNGSILNTIGITAGNKLLDVINTVADYRYVKPLVDQGRLLIGSPLVQATVQNFTTIAGGSVLTQAQADALCALGMSPDAVSELDVRRALYAVDGTWLGG